VLTRKRQNNAATSHAEPTWFAKTTNASEQLPLTGTGFAILPTSLSRRDVAETFALLPW
jgi:hypothetical protein